MVMLKLQWFKNIDRIEFDHSYDWDNRFNFEDVIEEKLNSELLNTLTWWLLSGGKNESLDSMELIEWHLFPNEEEPFCEEWDIECPQLWLVLKAIWITARYTKEGDNQKWELTLPKVLIDQFDAENNKKTITFYHTITSENKKYWSMHNVQDENTFKYLIKERTSGGGGSSSSTNNDNKEDKTEETEKTDTEEKTLNNMIENFIKNNSENKTILNSLSKAMESAIKSSYSQELKDAYTYAFVRGITTKGTIQQAELDRGMTRAEMAKMMAEFAQKVLGKKATKTDLPKYADISEIKWDLFDYIQLAYQLQIMGIDAKGNAMENFNPHGLVSRAEFATVLSRVLFGDKHNQTGADFYTSHLNALKEHGVLKNTNPEMQELRGWVMLMLMRTESKINIFK